MVSRLALDADEATQWATRPECGAVVTFCGTTRSTSPTGHDIIELEYDTEIDLAETRIRAVAASARARWPEIVAIAIHHRVGVVGLREPAVVVAVSSPHRHDAFDAARFCIDAVKRTVPLWKREVWAGGSTWSTDATSIANVEDL